jgi:hypothetical protein
MISVDARILCEMAQSILELRNYAEECAPKSLVETPGGVEMRMIENNKAALARLIQKCAELNAICEIVGAQFTSLEVTRLKDRLEWRHKPSWDDVINHLRNIDGRLKDELQNIPFLSLSSDDKKYFEPKMPLFGEDFTNRFKTVGAFELDEAAKCKALGRSTACVFHLMRVLEIGIRAMARCLGVPDPVKPAERNWGKILAKIKADIEAKWPTVADRSHGDGALF